MRLCAYECVWVCGVCSNECILSDFVNGIVLAGTTDAERDIQRVEWRVSAI